MANVQAGISPAVSDPVLPPSDSIPSDRPQPMPVPQPQVAFDPTIVPTQQTDQIPQLDDRPASMVMQSLPTVLADDPSSLNPPTPRPSAKEQVVSVVDQRVELPAGVSSVEAELSGEMPPEVQKYVEELKKHDDQLPQEIVIADQAVNPNMATPVAQPVIILPMTEQEIRVGKRAPVQSSTRWLAEFTEKIMKMFAGQVIFREEPS